MVVPTAVQGQVQPKNENANYPMNFAFLQTHAAMLCLRKRKYTSPGSEDRAVFPFDYHELG
jgi:hypothetical protein